jgi:rhodanese-related sulfurtransferase
VKQAFIYPILFFTLLACEYQDSAEFLPSKENFITSNKSDESNQEKRKAIFEKFDELKDEFVGANNIHIGNINTLIAPVFVDVREDREIQVSMIKNAISKNQFLENIEIYRKENIIVYCTIGYRSGLFAKELKRLGFNAYNLIGGVLIWSHMGYDFFNNREKTKNVHVYAKDWDFLHSDYQSIY